MKRKLLTSLKTWKDSDIRKPLLLRGARQVGKTYLLEMFGKESFSNYHILNFEKDPNLHRIFEEDLNPRRIIQDISFVLDKEIDLNNDLLIFDEIQYCRKALTSLKYFQEELPELALCSAGSLLGLELSGGSFPVGKVDFLDLYPMSFEEFLEGIGDSKSATYLKNFSREEFISETVHWHLWKQLKNYLIVGGLPEIVLTFRERKDNLFDAFKQVRKKQEDLITTYLADMAKHSGKQNSMHLERLWKNIPAQLAKEQDGSAPRFSFKSVIPGINRFSRLVGVIDWLNAAGLVIQVPIVNSGNLPFTAYSKENMFKLFLFDVGILCTLSQLPAKTVLDYDFGSYKGYVIENYVAQQFIGSGVKEIFCWRERTAEVEFLREVDGKVYPIEVKSGWVTQAKSLNVFAQKYNPPYRTVLSANKFHIDSKNKIHRYPLYLASRFPV